MAKKVLGQSAPAAGVVTTLGTVGAGKEWVGSSLTICNRSGVERLFRVAVSPAGAALADAHYIAYDAPVAANDMIALTIGITMAATDVIRVYGSSADLSFTLFGDEANA